MASTPQRPQMSGVAQIGAAALVVLLALILFSWLAGLIATVIKIVIGIAILGLIIGAVSRMGD